jgi:hypothetical protein
VEESVTSISRRAGKYRSVRADGPASGAGRARVRQQFEYHQFGVVDGGVADVPE